MPGGSRRRFAGLPYRIRYFLAWDHALCRALVAVAMRTIVGFLRRRVRQAGTATARARARRKPRMARITAATTTTAHHSAWSQAGR